MSVAFGFRAGVELKLDPGFFFGAQKAETAVALSGARSR